MNKTTEEIYRALRDDFARRSGLSPSDSGDIALRLYAFAGQLYALWVQSDWLCRQCFPQTAEGEWLDNHARLRGLQRNDAVCSQGVIRFQLQAASAGDVRIPEGCQCTTAAGLAFVTTESGTIPAGELWADVPARAALAGADGNVPEGAVCVMTNPPVGVAWCLNPEPFSGGVDTESDAQLRTRVLASYQRLPNGANAAFYEAQALSVEGVARAQVIPRARGIGTVDVIISAADGMPGESLVETVRQQLQAQREICVDIDVSAPMPVTVPVTVEIETAREQPETVTEAVRAALEGVFDGQLLGQKLTLARLGSVIYAVEGVDNYRIVAPAADVEIGETQLPVLGTLQVTEA